MARGAREFNSEIKTKTTESHLGIFLSTSNQ